MGRTKNDVWGGEGAGIAQLAGRAPLNREVVGSSPAVDPSRTVRVRAASLLWPLAFRFGVGPDVLPPCRGAENVAAGVPTTSLLVPMMSLLVPMVAQLVPMMSLLVPKICHSGCQRCHRRCFP